MKTTITSFCILLITFGMHAQDDKNLYSGGMLILQPGFTITTNPNQSIRNYSSAVGGILRMYFAEYYTAGIYGGSQQTNYTTPGSDNSYLHLGFGGAFTGLSIKSGKWRYTGSAFAGMGTFRNLHITEQAATNLSDAQLYQSSSLLYSPILSIDYALTGRIYLTIQTVCLIGKIDKKEFYNPTMQLGILFSR
jgi:hypothetical protein